MTFALRPRAERGIEEAATRYEAERPGLGSRFVAAALRAFELAADAPGAGRRVPDDPDIRRWNLAGFPYSFLYVEESGGIVVVAVVHHRRRPGSWRNEE